MKNKLLYILLGLLPLFFTDCKKSFLDVQDQGSISSANYPSSLENFSPLMASVYGAAHHMGLYGFAYFGYGVYCFDHTIDLQWRSDPAWNAMCDGLGAANMLGSWQLTYQWQDINSGVYYSNVVLDAIEKYRPKAKESEVAGLDVLEGEALFMRSYYRWHLQVFFGQPDLDGMGIPIINKVPETLSDMSVPRESTRDSYQAMIDDFTAAVPLLEGQSDALRPNAWSAKAALAKAYFYAQKYDSAETVLLDCINNSGKSLVSFDFYKKMFNGDPAYEHNPESFYEAEMIAQPNLGGGAEAPWGEWMAGSSMPTLYAPYYIDADGNRVGASWSNEYMHDRNLVRFGYHDETLISAVISNGSGGYTVDPAYLARQKAFRLAADYANDPDPRLYVAALQPWIDSMTVGGKPVKIGQAQTGLWYTMDPVTGNDPVTFYGWGLRKHNFLDGAFIESMDVSGSNNYFIRLPDIYLMHAEINKTTNPAIALEYVNKVHRRAYGYNPDASSPVDYLSLTDQTKAPADDQVLHNDPLLYERWAEFFGEGRWWEDVKRLKLGSKESAFYKTVSGGIPIGWSDTQYAMPIPASEFETNTNPGMVQNPGPWN